MGPGITALEKPDPVRLMFLAANGQMCLREASQEQ